MVRTAVIAAAAAAALLTPAVARSADEVLFPGVTYSRQVEFTPHGPVVVHVVTAPRPGGLYALRPALSNEAIQEREPLTAIERRLGAQATVVGVSGDDFSARDGIPAGGLIRGGVMDSSTDPARATLGVDADGTLRVDRFETSGTWKGSGQRRPLDVNRPPAPGTTTLYTRAWGPTAPTEAGAVQAVLAPFPAAAPNTDLEGRVVSLSANGPTQIPPNGAVLVARNAQAGRLSAEAPVGSSVSVRLFLPPTWQNVRDAIGGGPQLVRDGHPVYAAGEDFLQPYLFTRLARAAVGQTADGHVLLVTVDGGAGTSAGMTNWELALTLYRLGAVTAMALDGGAATTLAFEGDVLNRPVGAEQPIADALLVTYAGVYARPPAVDVVSPNGDGVAEDESFAYKLVRTSNVAVALVAPGGSTRTLVAGTQPAGVHTLPWTPDAATPEGRWTFRVTATDDLGRTSAAERAFAVDDTLKGVTAAPSTVVVGRRGGRLVVSFTLARAARVTVTIETRSGSVVRTLAPRRLGAGQQQVIWDGRAASGRVLPAAQYVARVRARSSVGEVDAIAPFRVARR